MATIDTLPWKPHGAGLGGEHAVIQFANGYGASVIRGGMFYTEGGTYEIGVLHGGSLDYENPVADGDVRGHLPEDEANKVLAEIEALPPKDASTQRGPMADPISNRPAPAIKPDLFFDGMTWPNPLYMAQLERKLRYASELVTREDQLTLASVCAAYYELYQCTAEKRVRVIRSMRALASTGAKR